MKHTLLAYENMTYTHTVYAAISSAFDACPQMVKGERCYNERCRKNHGKFARKDAQGKDKPYCSNYRNNKPCDFLWTQRGCYYNHHVKNGRVTGHSS